MNKVLVPVCICLIICINACQMFADEVVNEKQSVPASEKDSASPTKSEERPPRDFQSLGQHLKIHQQRTLDPAIFTMIRPYTLDRSPVKLPSEQILD